MDATDSQRVRKAAGRAFVAGAAVGILLLTILAPMIWKLERALKIPLPPSLNAHLVSLQFWHGVGWGFGIGVGIIIGGTILNVIVGLIDQTKSDITGS